MHLCEDCELDLDVFDGPFDLLVTLILRDEIDLWEVRVSRIIAEYILKLADSGEFDLEATSRFVVLVRRSARDQVRVCCSRRRARRRAR